jgi:hypothetical protein
MFQRGSRWVRIGGTFLLPVAILLVTAGIAPGALTFRFPRAYESPSKSFALQNCAQAHAVSPHWSARTGAGYERVAAATKTCPTHFGGGNGSSDASASEGLSVYVPVNLKATDHGVNVSWTVPLDAWESADLANFTAFCGGNTGFPAGSNCSAICPLTSSVNDYNFGYTWLNETVETNYCIVSALLVVAVDLILVDTTSGASYVDPSNGGIGPSYYLQDSAQIDTVAWTENYSNAPYWGQNSSGFSASNGYSLGPWTHNGTSTVSASIPGNFSSGDRYLLTSEFFAYVACGIGGYGPAGGSSHAFVQLGNASQPLQLAPLTIW